MTIQTIHQPEQVKKIAAHFNQPRVRRIIVRRDIRDNYEIDFYTGKNTASTAELDESDRIYLAQHFGLLI